MYNVQILLKRLVPALGLVLFSFMLISCSRDSSPTEQDFDAYLKHRSIGVRSDNHKQRVLDEFLRRETLANKIQKNFFKDDALIKAELNELRKEILITRYFERYLAENVSNQVVTNYYNNNIKNYEEHKVHVAHILVHVGRNMEETQRQVKLTTLQEAYSKINAGMTFEKAAERYSEDAVSAKKGGDLGWIKEGTIAEAFSERAFSLDIDQVSEPLETSFGYHILKVLEKPQVIRKPFKAVKGEIRYQLRTKYKKAEMQRLLEGVDIKLH